MRYRLLYLGGSSRKMTLPVLRKVRDLVNAGAVVAGDRPVGSPSLADNAAEFNAIADEIWGSAPKKGKVLAGGNPNQALAAIGAAPDFDCQQRDVMFVHRHLPDGDLYFLSNRTDQPLKLAANFRVSEKRPELWHADTGQVEPVSYQLANGRTSVPLQLGGNEAVYVVFRQASTGQGATVPAAEDKRLTKLEGPWDLSFAPNLGAPEKVSLAQLASWTENADPGVKYYSGTATYTKALDIPAAWVNGGHRLTLDLGEVHELAEVSLNGHPLGIAWHPPYRVDISTAVKPGANTLEVKVTNLWVNRLIGDQQPGAKKVTFTVMSTYKADAPLKPSGLLGPVQLLSK